MPRHFPPAAAALSRSPAYASLAVAGSTARQGSTSNSAQGELRQRAVVEGQEGCPAKAADRRQSARDPSLRAGYAQLALAEIPRLIGQLDRNPFRKTYGCFDREYFHYRTSDFPSEMYQEAVGPLAFVYAHAMPGNRWHGAERLRELVLAALKYAARSCHPDGSCDDYYPYERALGAAVFSLCAAAEAVELTGVDDPEVLAFLAKRATWIAAHDESGHLANHHALAARGLYHVAKIFGDASLAKAADERVAQVLAWQSPEGWFEEYGGADPGYQTVTIDALVACRALGSQADLDQPLANAVAFARHFLHPDHSYGGEYGSRGTYHFYPHGFERLAATLPAAADLADGFLLAVQHGKQAYFSDDRMYVHRLGNLLAAYRDWSSERAIEDSAEHAAEQSTINAGSRSTAASPSSMAARSTAASPPTAASPSITFPQAQLAVHRTPATCTILSLARGGIVKHFCGAELVANDAGAILELADGRIAVSQMHDRARTIAWPTDSTAATYSVRGPMHAARHETATPLKLVIFRLLLLTIGRFCRTFVRLLLQRRLITGRKPLSIEHARGITIEASGTLRIVDEITLADPRLEVRRLSFGVDHQTTYVAACGVYQDAALLPWFDGSGYVDELNRARKVRIERVFPAMSVEIKRS